MPAANVVFTIASQWDSNSSKPPQSAKSDANGDCCNKYPLEHTIADNNPSTVVLLPDSKA